MYNHWLILSNLIPFTFPQYKLIPGVFLISVILIAFGQAQSDHIKRFLLYLNYSLKIPRLEKSVLAGLTTAKLGDDVDEILDVVLSGYDLLT